MKFSIITLFPKIIKSYLSESIIKKAIEKNNIEIEILDLRSFSKLPHNQVDDYQFGGGRGMVLMCEPVVNAIRFAKKENEQALTILTSPQGKIWSQCLARSFVKQYEDLIIVCGHYEGFDERILNYVDIEVSIGDYVMTGGELASLVLLDTITRITPGVIKEESHLNESFENNLLDFAVYTKPVVFENYFVPDVLLSGHHKKIQDFRDISKLENTFKKRPDLINESSLNEIQLKKLKQLKGE